MTTNIALPNQLSLDDILKAAKDEPARIKPLASKDLLSTVATLREDKHFAWEEVATWVADKTGVVRTANYWSQQYGSFKGTKKKSRASKTPKVVVSPESTSPATVQSAASKSAV